MTTIRFIRRLRTDNRGSTIIEFAMLAPIIFGLMLGVLQVGLQMHASNAVRSIVTESARYTMVEYQKDNDITTEQIESRMLALAVNPPYGLSIDNVTVQVSQVASGITGTRRYNMRMTYVPQGVLGVLGIGSPTIVVNRPVYVS
ncbi:MAG: TadE/TadG family type IV pilus assembly protein [Novosphingobium sp.]|jgi:Flp pilus assembly protein TadG|nr:pilus assembly protein [Brevundimonas sp.]MCZ8320259.1 pilus assembly protein [Novosphingobium sp.]